MGTSPRLSAASFFSSLSTKMTSWPRSAKQAPATKPTYPEPTTAICMRPFSPKGQIDLQQHVTGKELTLSAYVNGANQVESLMGTPFEAIRVEPAGQSRVPCALCQAQER